MWSRTYAVESFDCFSMIQTLTQAGLKSHDKKLFIIRRLAHGCNHFESIGNQLRGKNGSTKCFGRLLLQGSCDASPLWGTRVDGLDRLLLLL